MTCKVCRHAPATHPIVTKLRDGTRLCMISGCYCMEYHPDSRRYKGPTPGSVPHGLKFDAVK